MVRYDTEHRLFPGTLEMIAAWEIKQHQKMIDAMKYLKVGKSYGFCNLFLFRNENLHLADGSGVTVAFHLRMLFNFMDKDLYNLASCCHPDNSIILEIPALEHHKLEDLNLDLVKMTLQTE